MVVRLILILVACLLGSVQPMDWDKLLQQKENSYRQHLQSQEQAWTQCTTNPQSPTQVRDFGLFPGRGPAVPGGGRRRRAVETDFMTEDTALLLNANTGSFIKDSEEDEVIPRGAFTLELWWKPEGGLPNPANVLEAEDLCTPFPQKGWTLGIWTLDTAEEKDARFFFRLQAAKSRNTTTIISPVSYVPGEWSHIAISYDHYQLKMYVNGAQVGASFEQKGPTFGKAASDSCRILRLGGQDDHHFRGTVDNLRLWARALSHPEIVEIMAVGALKNNHRLAEGGLVLQDIFDGMDQWEWTSSNRVDHPIPLPLLVVSDTPRSSYESFMRPQPCGFTVCDVPEVVQSYQNNWELRRPKTVRYRVLNVYNADGSNPTVTEDQIQAQQRRLELAFAPYNISWVLHREAIFNTSLRRKTIVFGCNSAKIGDGKCNTECQFEATGNDGGDCDLETRVCDSKKFSNGQCDTECNTGPHGWDGGDCCGPSADSCFDPSSAHRTYMDVFEYKKLLNFSNSKYINVLFARWTNKDILGVAATPWDKDALTEQGGIVVDPNEFGLVGHMDTLVHEIGHALGLWHVHRGITEVNCNDPCFEKEASMTEGDLCDDTAPTPANGQCRDPPPEVGFCGISRFRNTPFMNYMSYTDDACTDTFTEQQVARMHCYLHLRYLTIQELKDELPGPPLPPRVVAAADTSVTIAWTPPLAIVGFHDNADCSLCTENRELVQFAKEAFAPESSYGDYGDPSQATGPPDAQTCGPSCKVWMPEPSHCMDNGCTLIVTLGHPVIPALLSVWVSWSAHNGLSDIEFVFTDGTSDVVTGLQTYCDMPLTLPVFYQKTLEKLVLRTNHSYVSVDAIQVVSTPNHPVCASCKPLRYRVFRQPPFELASSKEADGIDFTDREVIVNQEYKYRVQAWLGTRLSTLSPQLVHRHGTSFCGDGRIDMSESCDDGNLRDGDGCSSTCSEEKSFHCKGEPSLCFWHIGDGICEDFEKSVSVQDCGYFTPDGFQDQWASSISIKPNQNIVESCSPEVIIGPPAESQVTCGCTSDTVAQWFPCDDELSENFWLVAWFPRPVVATSVHLYFHINDLTSSTYSDRSITLWLVESTGQQHFLETVTLSCSNNPLAVDIVHNLSKPFFLTAGINVTFDTNDIAIKAVRLRSSVSLNPVTVGQCGGKQLYSPRLQKCVSYPCKLPSCPQPMSKHSKLACDGLEEGDSCRIACNDGHWRLENADVVTCSDGDWVGADIHCKPVDCGPPVIAHADAICPDGTTYGKTCNFKCRPPARLRGGSSSLGSVVCEKDGQWSISDIQCQLTCAVPSAPSHAVLDSQQCRQTEHLVFGHRCRFRCKVGYHVEGFSVRKRTMYLQCDSTGSWSGPECVPVTCPPPPMALNGLYNCTNGRFAGSICTVFCAGENEQASSSRCELDGTWSQPFLPCSLNGKTCPEPKASDTTIHFLCDSNLIGATCKVSCALSDTEAVLDESSVDVKKIVCTGQGRWQPDSESITCKKKCKYAFVGDKYCDGINNQERCDWDGGDCCSSTVRDHVVKPFLATCKEECQCLDPNAIENRPNGKSKNGDTLGFLQGFLRIL